MDTTTPHEKVDFDRFAEEYEALLNNQNFGGGDRSYFSEYKASTLARLLGDKPRKILDFGAGIGLTIPYLQRFFPQADIFATDISERSLDYLRRKFPDVSVVPDEAVGEQKFDLILVITVMHHVEPRLRDGLMRRLRGMLNPGGRLCIFEHNPYNPLTQRMVSTCPFDSDAVLLNMAESRDLIGKSAGLNISHTGYTLFMPHLARRLRFLEPYLGWLPLGGQYYVIGTA